MDRRLSRPSSRVSLGNEDAAGYLRHCLFVLNLDTQIKEEYGMYSSPLPRRSSLKESIEFLLYHFIPLYLQERLLLF